MHQEAARISHSSSQAAPTIMYASTPAVFHRPAQRHALAPCVAVLHLCSSSVESQGTVVYCAATQATNMLFLSLENQPILSYLYSIAIITLD